MIAAEQDRFQTTNAKFKAILAEAKSLAKTLNPVIIHGETGTGRREMALYIFENSQRSDKPLTYISKDHFYISDVDNTGTVIIENISELSAEQQKSLLPMISRSLSKGLSESPRWIATAPLHTHQMIKDGSLDVYLYQALSTQKIYMPSLKERSEDLKMLVDNYVEKLNLLSATKKTFDTNTFKVISNKEFKGNITELFTYIDSLFIGSSQEKNESIVKTQAGMTLSEMEKKLILQTLEITNQNRTKAAEILGISIRTLRNKLNEYRLGGQYESAVR